MPIPSTKHICGKGWHLNLNGNYELGQSVLFDVSLTQKMNNNVYHCGEDLFFPLGLCIMCYTSFHYPTCNHCSKVSFLPHV